MHSHQGHRLPSSAGEPTKLDAEIEADLNLAPEIVPSSLRAPKARKPKTILLTGTTGFLGSYLLRDCLAHSAARVVCLVRADSPEHARRRIEETLQSYALSLTAAQWARVETLPGDLSLPHFGLKKADYAALVDRVDTVMHGAASVNFYQTYRQLRGTNVGGVIEILRFVVQGQAKALHYVSSTGVFDSDACRGKVMRETDAPDHCDGSVMGYTQTKWVAEHLVLAARARGIPASVYRPPFIMGDSRSGVVDIENLVVKMLIGSLQGGSWPDEQTHVEMVPVDSLSRAIVHLACLPDQLGRTFHLNSPGPMRWTDIGLAARTYGYTLALPSYDEWKRRLSEFGRHKHNVLRPLLRFYTKTPPRLSTPAPEVFTRPPRPIFDSTATQALLEPAGLVPPRMTHGLFAIYLGYFVRQGWLKSPAALADSPPPRASCGTHA